MGFVWLVLFLNVFHLHATGSLQMFHLAFEHGVSTFHFLIRVLHPEGDCCCD